MEQSFPVAVTEEAWQNIGRLLSRKGEAGDCLRIGVKGGGCSGLEYVFKIESQTRPSDLALQNGDLKVVCDPKSAEYLRGSTLNYTGNLIGGGFAFDNPNATRSCGCGTSFTPKKQDSAL